MISNSNQRWLRSPHGLIAGVCKGLAEQFGLEAWLIRLVWIIGACMGVGIITYFIFWICLPRADRQEQGAQKIILGVCARLHRRGDIDVGLARLLAVLLFFFSGGAAVVGYIVLYFLLPENKSA